jgi:hypothetical protein
MVKTRKKWVLGKGIMEGFTAQVTGITVPGFSTGREIFTEKSLGKFSGIFFKKI